MAGRKEHRHGSTHEETGSQAAWTIRDHSGPQRERIPVKTTQVNEDSPGLLCGETTPVPPKRDPQTSPTSPPTTDHCKQCHRIRGRRNPRQPHATATATVPHSVERIPP